MLSWLALVCFLVNLLAQVLPAASLPPRWTGTADLAAVYTLCAAHASDDQQAGGHPVEDQDRHGAHCVFCLPFFHGSAALPVSALLAIVPLVSWAAYVVPRDPVFVVPVRLSSSSAPRAPPVLG